MFTHRLKCNEKIIYACVYVFLREVNNEEGNDVLNHNTQSDSKITHSFGKESSQNRRDQSWWAIIESEIYFAFENTQIYLKYHGHVPNTASKHRPFSSRAFFIPDRSSASSQSSYEEKNFLLSKKKSDHPSRRSARATKQNRPTHQEGTISEMIPV